MQIKKVFNSLTATSVFWLVLGVIILIVGVYVGYKWRMYYFAFGLFSTGFGVIFCGLTNGFTDHSPTGRIVSKFGILALLAGLVLTLYYVSKFV